MKNGRAKNKAHNGHTKAKAKSRSTPTRHRSREEEIEAHPQGAEDVISFAERKRRAANAQLFREWRGSAPAFTREELSARLGQLMSHARSVSTIRNWETGLRDPRLVDVQACEAIKGGLSKRLFADREIAQLRSHAENTEHAA